MKKLTLLFLFFTNGFLFANGEIDCFQLYIQEGDAAMLDSNYNYAIKSYSGALKCPLLNAQQKAEAIRKNNEAFAASRQLVENALAKEEKERKQKEIESMRANGYLKALRAEDLLNDEEPERALDSAYAAMQLFEGKEKPAEQVRAIFGQAVKANFAYKHEENKTDNIKEAAFFSSSNKVYIVSRNKTIKIIDPSNKIPISESGTQDDYIMLVADNEAHARFVSADRTGNIGFSEKGGRLIGTTEKGHEGMVYFAKYSPDGKYLLTGAIDKTAKLWEAKTGALIKPLTHDGRVYNGHFSKNRILTRCSDGAAYLWDINGNLIKKLNAQKGILKNIAFSKGGKKIITVASNNSVFIWDENGNKTGELNADKMPFENAGFSPDGKYILTNTFDGQPKLWKSDGSFIKKISLQYESKMAAPVYAQFLKDGKNILVHSANYFQIQNIDNKNNSLIFNDPEADLTKVAVSSDGNYILTANKKNRVRLWNKEGEELMAVEDHKGAVEGLSFSDDGRYFLSYAADGTLVTCPLPQVVYKEMNKKGGK